jgi:hypothetical protein
LSASEQRFGPEVTRNAVINFNEAFLAHKSNLDPVFATGRDHWRSILLRVNAFPNFLVGVHVLDEPVFGQLELRSYPLCVGRHTKAKIETVFNWN